MEKGIGYDDFSKATQNSIHMYISRCGTMSADTTWNGEWVIYLYLGWGFDKAVIVGVMKQIYSTYRSLCCDQGVVAKR